MSAENGTRRLRLAIAAALVALAFAVHARALGHRFVNFDDPTYVTENDHVRAGLTGASVRWAFTSPTDGNWHPLTMLSHMADVEVWGDRASGHHVTSLLIHAVNAAILFLLLSGLGGDPWRAGLAAALFAVHPLNVESVAWVAERKNLLSTLFWLLALLGWDAYVRRPRARRYLLVLALAVLALASKPMAVTLPFTLLLVDWLRLEKRTRRGETRTAMALRLAAEKLPFLAASAACGVATLWAQTSLGAVRSVDAIPAGARLANAVVSAAWYLVKMVWPTDLAVYYPHPESTLPAWQVGGSLLLLTLVTVAAVKAGRAASVAWTWYLVTLLPVLGLVQVGSQARADRYAYVPLIGPLAAAAWALPPWGAARTRRSFRALALATGLAAVAALGAVAWMQEGDWRNSVTLFERSVAVSPRDPLGHDNLGMALVERGKLNEAIVHFRRATELDPRLAPAHMNLGNALAMKGRIAEAIGEYETAARLAPEDPRVRYDLGRSLLHAGKPDAAEKELREAIRLFPGYARAHAGLASALAATGRPVEARREAREAILLAPDDPAVRAEIRALAR